MITSDPILAVMKALDSGVRTQAAADLEEAGCRVQTSGNRGTGAGHNADYWPVYACIARMEREQPGQAATIYTLYAPTEAESNEWLDAFHGQLLIGMIEATPGWKDLRKKKREMVEWLLMAAIFERRHDLERVRPSWGPEAIAYHLAEQHGVRLSVSQWKRDWAQFWNVAQGLIDKAEDAAQEPICAALSHEREKYRNEMQRAA